VDRVAANTERAGGGCVDSDGGHEPRGLRMRPGLTAFGG
jgi:hypothetical protein